jgi:hypothetical protein
MRSVHHQHLGETTANGSSSRISCPGGPRGRHTDTFHTQNDAAPLTSLRGISINVVFNLDRSLGKTMITPHTGGIPGVYSLIRFDVYIHQNSLGFCGVIKRNRSELIKLVTYFFKVRHARVRLKREVHGRSYDLRDKQLGYTTRDVYFFL